MKKIPKTLPLMTREEEDKAMKVLMDQLAKEERIAVIEYYISVFFLSLISIGFGAMMGSAFL